MATIINNELVASETRLRLGTLIQYIPDPRKGEPLAGGQLFFGVPGRDPYLAKFQKIVYALQEDGSSVPLEQPVTVGPGGVPVDENGNIVSLATSGSFSFKARDSLGTQVYDIPKIEAINNQGFSGVIIDEPRTVVSGQLSSPFTEIEATTASFYASTNGTDNSFNGRYMRVNVDYEIMSTSQIRLLTTYPDGTVVIGRQMDPTGQIVPVTSGSSAMFVFQTIAEAKMADLQVDDTVTINGQDLATDGLGGSKYVTVAPNTGTPDDENFILLNNTNQLQLLESNNRFKKYAEVTQNPTITNNELILDAELGVNAEVALTADISTFQFTNLNSGSDLVTTFTVRFTQGDPDLRNITWPDSVLWAGGTAPTMTQTAGAVDIYGLITYDGGTTFYGAVIGQNFS